MEKKLTHKQIYNKAKKLSQELHIYCNLLGDFENKLYGFEFAETDSDAIIDTINYGIQDLSFDDYIKEMEFYKKSFDENDGDLKANGIY